MPVFAADRTFDITGWAAWVDPNSNGTFNSPTPNQPLDVNFDGKLGYGASVNVFFGEHISTEFGAFWVRPDARFSNGGPVFTGGDLKMIPITAVLQYHILPKGFIDPYVGAGAAYVLFDNVSGTSDLKNVGINQINFKDDVGLALNAGIGFALTPNFAIVADGKYVPLKSSATAVYATGTNSPGTKVKINPVIFSAGLSLRF
ncbi:MAG: rane protein [Acidobacteria bacterium]|nr:rane protein [Acidobacteriota bacterium]